MIRVGTEKSSAMRSTGASGLLHTSSATRISSRLEKYAMMFRALLPVPDAKIAMRFVVACIGAVIAIPCKRKNRLFCLLGIDFP
jgi:hypothetical protein